jgi:hypothetical protein
MFMPRGAERDRVARLDTAYFACINAIATNERFRVADDDP